MSARTLPRKHAFMVSPAGSQPYPPAEEPRKPHPGRPLEHPSSSTTQTRPATRSSISPSFFPLCPRPVSRYTSMRSTMYVEVLRRFFLCARSVHRRLTSTHYLPGIDHNIAFDQATWGEDSRVRKSETYTRPFLRVPFVMTNGAPARAKHPCRGFRIRYPATELCRCSGSGLRRNKVKD